MLLRFNIAFMKPMTLKKRRMYFYLLLVVFFIIIPLITLYTSGYRFQGFKLVETGGIYVYSPESGSEIYIDGKKEKETGIFQKDWFVQNMKPGSYEILISKEGFWPWLKEVKVEEKRVTEAIAFLVPKELNAEIIPQEIEGETATSTIPNLEYARISKLFEDKFTVPADPVIPEELDSDEEEIEFEKISRRDRVGIWREGNQIFAKWLKNEEDTPNFFCRDNSCVDIVTVFSSVELIKTIDFYPGRDDVVLVAVSNGIFAIEIDIRTNQNFQPIYKGTSPLFIISDKQFYVKDLETIFKVNI